MKTRCAALLLALTFSLNAQAQAPAKAEAPAPAADAAASRREQLAMKLMEMTGAAQLGLQVMNSMITELQKNPKIPSALVERVKRNAKPEALTRLLIPIYTDNLTEGEMQAAIRFYETPEGQSMLRKMPAMMQQSMQAGQQWGMQLVEQSVRELREEEAGAAPGEQPAEQAAPQPAPKKKSTKR